MLPGRSVYIRSIMPASAGAGIRAESPNTPRQTEHDKCRRWQWMRTDGYAPWGGTIDTDMGDQVLVTRARNLGTNDVEAARRQVIQRLPIGRMGTPNDIAKGIVFLASDDAGFMTGAGLVVDGGLTAQ